MQISEHRATRVPSAGRGRIESQVSLRGSSYLPELLGLADRVLVLRDEAIAGELPAGASEEAVLQLASGGVVAIGEAERDHLHGIPGMVNDPHFNPVIHQNIEKVSNA